LIRILLVIVLTLFADVLIGKLMNQLYDVKCNIRIFVAEKAN